MLRFASIIKIRNEIYKIYTNVNKSNQVNKELKVEYLDVKIYATLLHGCNFNQFLTINNLMKIIYHHITE